MNCLRTLLWPILWWGFLQAAYCDDAPKPRVILTAEQFEQLEKLGAEMKALNDDENRTIVSDGATIAALKGSAQALNASLAAARESGDRASAEVAKLEGDYLLAKAAAHRRGWIILGEGVLILGLLAFIFRKPLLALFA